jgi:hypothetical protein
MILSNLYSSGIQGNIQFVSIRKYINYMKFKIFLRIYK